jgi:hypothetical protein
MFGNGNAATFASHAKGARDLGDLDPVLGDAHSYPLSSILYPLSVLLGLMA